MNVERTMQRAVLRRLAGSPDGRAHILSTTVEAEEGDESGIFEQLIAQIDEPKLQRLAERHLEDELRHAKIFRDWLERLDLPFTPSADDEKLIHQIGVESGAVGEGVHSNDQLVATYAMLYVIEERGVERYPWIADAVEPHVPELAETYRAVARDEQRHVRYCRTIGRKYAGSDSAWDDLVSVCRGVERAAFRKVGSATLVHLLDENLLRLPTAMNRAGARVLRSRQPSDETMVPVTTAA